MIYIQIYVHLQEILIKAFKEQDWENDLQIVIQNYGVNEFDVLSLIPAEGFSFYKVAGF